MKCPHCQLEIHPSFNEIYIGLAINLDHYSIFEMTCPSSECRRMIIALGLSSNIQYNNLDEPLLAPPYDIDIIYPIESPLIRTANILVDKKFADDFNEACIIVPYSPKASAALSRRCLQSLLRDKAGVTKSNLSKEIQEIIDKGNLPSHLIESIDAIRQIGNFAAHPQKSLSTGEIIEVEPGEAEWLLDILEGLFDFYFVQPKIMQEKKEALNKKLVEAGKHEMK